VSIQPGAANRKILNKREFGISGQLASPQPLSNGEGLKNEEILKVLSFGEDLGDANRSK
jgi:hypothetical protein